MSPIHDAASGAATAATLPNTSTLNPWRAVAIAGLAVGILDGADGAAFYWFAHGLNPHEVFQFIASGALGADAFQGGLATAALGALIHFGLAFGFAGAFVLAYRANQTLRRHWVVASLVYGVAVWGLMTFIVLPLSALAPSVPTTGDIVNGVIDHALAVGLVSGYVARRNFGR